jgi:drug/metabolite transporter (DMT)-like permease
VIPARTSLPALAVIVGAVFWGLWWLPLRWLAERGLSADWANLVIYAAAAALLVPFAWSRIPTMRAGGWNLLVTTAMFGVVLVLWNYALLLGEVVRVFLLFYLTPVWATVLAYFLLREPIGPLRGLAIVLGLGGAAIVLGFEGGPPLPRTTGDWLGLLSGLLFALAMTLTRKAAFDAGLERTFLSFVFAAVAAVILVLFGVTAAPTGRDVLAAAPLAAVIAIVWVVPGTWLVLWAASRLDPGRVAILMLLEVVVAAVSASALTEEPFGWRETAGCVLIIAAGLVEGWQELRRAPA